MKNEMKRNIDKTAENKVRSEYEEGSWEDKKHGKKNRRIGNCEEYYSRSKTRQRKFKLKDLISKIEAAKCGKLQTEYDKNIENWEKITWNRDTSKYEEGSWEDKKTRKEEQKN